MSARQVAVKLDKKCKTSETCISSGVARGICKRLIIDYVYTDIWYN
jgi:hypothetical protein